MFENQNFNSFFKREKAWNVTDVLLLSYSLNPRMLNEILVQTGIAEYYCNQGEGEVKEFAKHVDCRIDANRYVEDGDIGDFPYARIILAEGKIKGIDCEGKSYHPKLWLFLMKNKDDEKIRLIISSRNITKKNMIEGALCLEGEVGKNGIENNGNENNGNLISFLTKKSDIDEKNVIVQKLKNTDFTPSIRRMLDLDDGNPEVKYEFYFPGQGNIKLSERIKGDATGGELEKGIIVSPFLGNYDFIERFITNKTKIITNTKIPKESLPKDQSGNASIDEHFFVYEGKSKENESDTRETDTPETDKTEMDTNEGYSDIFLHAKVYAFDYENKRVLYIGSSNFSENGLEKNAELLCRIEVQFEEQSEKIKFADSLYKCFDSKKIRTMEQADIMQDEDASDPIEPVKIPECSLTEEEKQSIYNKMKMDIERMQLADVARIVTGESVKGEPLDFLISKLNSCPPDKRENYRENLAEINKDDYPEIIKNLINEMEECLQTAISEECVDGV